jgi:hypothetical protein
MHITARNLVSFSTGGQGILVSLVPICTMGNPSCWVHLCTYLESGAASILCGRYYVHGRSGSPEYNRFAQEKELCLRFAPAYDQYRQHTPFVIPKILENPKALVECSADRTEVKKKPRIATALGNRTVSSL